MKKFCRCFCFFIVTSLMFISTSHAQEIFINEAWVRGIPSSAKTTAAFMTIRNNASEEIVLKSATCEIAETVQIHTMEHVGELMKMKEVNELRIPAGEEAVLAPKGYHIMLIGLFRPITEGEMIPLALNFADGITVKVDALVRKWGPMSPMSHN